jgi:hypothetical protein
MTESVWRRRRSNASACGALACCVLVGTAADDAIGRPRVAAFLQGLGQLDWMVGRNVRMDIRWSAADADHARRYAAELVTLERAAMAHAVRRESLAHCPADGWALRKTLNEVMLASEPRAVWRLLEKRSSFAREEGGHGRSYVHSTTRDLTYF